MMDILTPLLNKSKSDCKGFSYNTPDGKEYDCSYKYSGDITCDQCIFGGCGGKLDPRIKSHRRKKDKKFKEV